MFPGGMAPFDRGTFLLVQSLKVWPGPPGLTGRGGVRDAFRPAAGQSCAAARSFRGRCGQRGSARLRCRSCGPRRPYAVGAGVCRHTPRVGRSADCRQRPSTWMHADHAQHATVFARIRAADRRLVLTRPARRARVDARRERRTRGRSRPCWRRTAVGRSGLAAGLRPHGAGDAPEDRQRAHCALSAGAALERDRATWARTCLRPYLFPNSTAACHQVTSGTAIKGAATHPMPAGLPALQGKALTRSVWAKSSPLNKERQDTHLDQRTAEHIAEVQACRVAAVFAGGSAQTTSSRARRHAGLH